MLKQRNATFFTSTSAFNVYRAVRLCKAFLSMLMTILKPVAMTLVCIAFIFAFVGMSLRACDIERNMQQERTVQFLTSNTGEDDERI